MGDVLIATDGSDWAEVACERAIEIADERDATLHVLCVVDRREFSEAALSSSYLATIEAEDEGHDCVERVRNRAEAAGVDVETEVCHGVPEESIREVAASIGADVVVMGEHGDHTKHLGGVGRRVRDECDCEVITVSRKVPA